jgi:hypothetical protein
LDQPVDSQFPDDVLRCPRCFSKDIAPSISSGWIDDMMWHFGRIPRQCRYCGKRFYVREPEGKDV